MAEHIIIECKDCAQDVCGVSCEKEALAYVCGTVLIELGKCKDCDRFDVSKGASKKDGWIVRALRWLLAGIAGLLGRHDGDADQTSTGCGCCQRDLSGSSLPYCIQSCQYGTVKVALEEKPIEAKRRQNAEALALQSLYQRDSRNSIFRDSL